MEVSVGALLLVVAIFWTTLDMTQCQKNVTPFTMQEWWGAIRDGYLGKMVEFYFCNGRL